MFLKSKWFWICSIITLCAAIFIGIVVHRANQPQEVIKVYKAVELPQYRTPQVPPLESTNAGADTEAPVETRVETRREDFSQDIETDTPEAFTAPADALPAADINTAEVSDPNAEADAEAAALADALASVAGRLEEVRVELPRALEDRIEVLQLSDELVSYVSSHGITPELSALADKLNRERDELREKISGLCNEYLMYTLLDGSPFEPGGEYYELMERNGIGIVVNK